jgi:1,4-alpha-glucan branching enzyme
MTNLSPEDIDKIINSNHWDPFQVLGFHGLNGKSAGNSVIRFFIPEVKNVEIIINQKSYVMEKIHETGLYEYVLDKKEKPEYKFKITNWENHSWELNDPYCFSPVFTDYDLHLFSEGNHFKIYEKLGAHLMNHEKHDGVFFSVWAPNAKRVSVIGNFNHWDGRCNPMRSRGTSGIWEIFIPDLAEGEIYKFEIKTTNDRILVKADPYAFKSELRPKTASIVYSINSYQWNDTDYCQKRMNNLNSAVSIYEIHAGSWKRKDNNEFLSYRELADELVEYVTEMGYTHIELMPIAEHPFDGSWGYQVTGYFAPTSRYGSPEDFCYFIDKCHQKGIGVILDWVPAHFPTDAFGLAQFDGTCLYEHEDPRKGFHKDWSTLIFNYGRNEVRNFLISNALFWLQYYHIDGLRVDAVASILYLDYARKKGEWIPNEFGGNENLDAIYFLKKLNEQVYSEFPGTMMIAEESTAWLGVSKPTYLGGLGFGYKWNMGWMNDFLFYIQKEPVHRKFHHNNLTFSMIYAFNENFILVLSHDEVVHGKSSLLGKMPGDDWQKFANLRASLGYMYAHPGKKLLFMGGEFGQWKEWNNDTALDWNLLEYGMHKKLQAYNKNLNHTYRDNSALFENDYVWNGFEWINSNDGENSIISFLRKGNGEEDIMLVVINFTPIVRYNYRVGVPKHNHWYEIMNSDAEEFGGSGIGNLGGFWSETIPWNNQQYSLNLTIPPLAALYFSIKNPSI